MSRSVSLRSAIFILFSLSGIIFRAASVALAAEDQDITEKKFSVVHSLGITTGLDYVAPSAGDEIRESIEPGRKISVNSSVPVGFRYGFSFTHPEILHYLPGGYQGVAVGVLNLGGAESRGVDKSSRNVGYPVLAYLFQGGPVHNFNERLSIDYEWNFGASFGWKPYSPKNSNFNLVVGSRVNAYLNLGLNLSWALTDNARIFGGISVSHFSNGNTSFPNPGINSFGVRIGMVYTLNPLKKGFAPRANDTVGRRKVEYDILAWGATRKRLFRGIESPVLLPGNYACAGISFSPMVRLNPWWRVGGSLDLQWDRSSDMKRVYIGGTTTDDIRFRAPSFWRQTTIGLSAHAELQMPVFAVNVGCGYNLKAPWENRGTYQNIALKVYVWHGLFVNIGYQLRNFRQQSSLMLGAGITI